MKHIYFDNDFDLVSWVIDHKDKIIHYRAWDSGATIFEMCDGNVICIYT